MCLRESCFCIHEGHWPVVFWCIAFKIAHIIKISQKFVYWYSFFLHCLIEFIDETICAWSFLWGKIFKLQI